MKPHPFFDDVEVSDHVTKDGTWEVPVRLYDAAMLGLVYRIEPDAAAQAMVQPSLEPLVTMGKAMVQVLIVEAREASLDAFAQIAVALLVRRCGTSPSRVHALLDPHRDVDQGYLPLGTAVSTVEMVDACAALWGLSAYRAEIQTDFRPVGVRAEVVGELEVMIGEAGSMKTRGPAIALVSGSTPPVRTPIRVDHRLEWGGGASASLRVVGEGPVAEAVIRLGLEGIRPRYAWRSLSSRALLPLGESLGV